jgi:hypothetical protein
VSAPEHIVAIYRSAGYTDPVATANLAWSDIEQGHVDDEELEDAASFLDAVRSEEEES